MSTIRSAAQFLLLSPTEFKDAVRQIVHRLRGGDPEAFAEYKEATYITDLHLMTQEVLREMKVSDEEQETWNK